MGWEGDRFDVANVVGATANDNGWAIKIVIEYGVGNGDYVAAVDPKGLSKLGAVVHGGGTRSVVKGNIPKGDGIRC